MAITVTVLGWEKYNGKKKKGHQCIMLSTRFFDDPKIRMLSLSERYAYLWLLLRCGDEARNTIECLPIQLRDACGLKSFRPLNALLRLEELRLVTIEKNAAFNTLQDKTVHNSTRRRPPKGADQNPKPEQRALAPVAKAPGTAGELIAFYCDAWKARYKAEKSPPILPQHASQMKKLVGQVGIDRGKVLVEAYLRMPDSWFLTKSHDIPTLMGNLNKVSQFVDTGKMISKSEINQVDKAVSNNNTLSALRRGEV